YAEDRHCWHTQGRTRGVKEQLAALRHTQGRQICRSQPGHAVTVTVVYRPMEPTIVAKTAPATDEGERGSGAWCFRRLRQGHGPSVMALRPRPRPTEGSSIGCQTCRLGSEIGVPEPHPVAWRAWAAPKILPGLWSRGGQAPGAM